MTRRASLFRHLHPLFLSLLPVLTLAAHNIQELRPEAILRSLALAPLAALLLLLLARAAVGDWGRASLIASILVLVLGSYGHIYSVLKPLQLSGLVIGRHRHLLPASVAIVAIGFWAILRRDPPSPRVLQALSVSALLGIAIPTFQIGIFFANNPVNLSNSPTSRTAAAPSTLGGRAFPDVYYIILDGYSRADVLQKRFGYDNAGFSQSLEARGFYVAANSRSNYVGTGLSLASSLNMAYLQDSYIDINRGYYPHNLQLPIQESLVRHEFIRRGYATVSFPTAYYPTEIENADYYLTPETRPLESLQLTGRLNEFEGMLLRGTTVQAFLDLQILRSTGLGELLAEELDEERYYRREVILSAVDHVQDVPKFGEPTFTFVHLITPHQPYIFDRDGEVVSLEALQGRTGNLMADDNSFYLDQLIYANQLALEMIDAILARSHVPPIILLQADHGGDFGLDWENPQPNLALDRSAILNAYLVPNECQDDLYPSISPVNSFRVVFDCAFGADYPLLPDRSYFSNIHSNRRLGAFEFTPIATDDQE